MRSFRFILPVLVFFAQGASAQDSIFVVSDAYGLKPDGGCLELKSGTFEELEKKNGNWDAATKTILLYAAKNEEIATQIIIPREGKDFWAKMSDLSGPKTIAADRASFSAIVWVNKFEIEKTPKKDKHEVKLSTTAPEFAPDLVIPLNGSVKDIKRFDIPVAFSGIPQAKNKAGAMLFEVWVPKDTSAGVYKGTVSVMQAENEIEKLNVQLQVWDFVLPDTPTFAFDLLDYGMPHEKFKNTGGFLIKGDGLGAKAQMMGEKDKAIDYQVYKLAMDNRCFVNVLPYSSQRGNPRYAYPVDGKGKDAKITSYAEYDDYFAPILDGKVNKFGQPPMHFTLAFNINYPYTCAAEPAKQFDLTHFKTSIPEGPGKDPKLAEFEESYKAIAEQTVAHLAEKGWTKTQFEVYNNQKPHEDPKEARNRTPWKLDEPTSSADYHGLRYLLNLSHTAFASAKEKGIQIVNRLDIGHWNCDKFQLPDGKPSQCRNPKEFNTADADKYLKGQVEHWVINVIHVMAAQPLLKDYEAPGVKLMTYTGTGSNEIASSYMRFQGGGFVNARIGLVGQIIFEMGLSAADPNKQTGGSYDSCCMYNGSTMGFEGALPTHRLKLWRNAVNDFDYITAAKAKNAAAVKAIINKMTATDRKGTTLNFVFTNNVEDLIAARAKLAEIITGQKTLDIEINGFSDKYNGTSVKDTITNYD